MATEEELFAAVRLIEEHCQNHYGSCSDCPLSDFCFSDIMVNNYAPRYWPDPELLEGGCGNEHSD